MNIIIYLLIDEIVFLINPILEVISLLPGDKGPFANIGDVDTDDGKGICCIGWDILEVTSKFLNCEDNKRGEVSDLEVVILDVEVLDIVALVVIIFFTLKSSFETLLDKGPGILNNMKI